MADTLENMITKIIRYILVIWTCLIFGACGRRIPDSLIDINKVIAQLDSAINAMYGWEPSDSTYNKMVDTLVLGILKDHVQNNGIDINVPVTGQGAFDDARETWATFKSLCKKKEFEQALDFYLAEKNGGEGTNAGDFLIFLKHSTHRYSFFSKVLLPLLREYKGDIYAFDKYIETLQFEKAMEEFSITLHQGEEGYIPEVYPAVIKDLGFALAASGKLDEAFDLISDLSYAVYDITGSALYADFFGTQYGAQLYEQAGDKEAALEMWNGFKKHVEEHVNDYDAEEVERSLQRLEIEMEKLR